VYVLLFLLTATVTVTAAVVMLVAVYDSRVGFMLDSLVTNAISRSPVR